MARPSGKRILKLATFLLLVIGVLFLFAGYRFDVETISGILGEVRIEGATFQVFRPEPLRPGGNGYYLLAADGRVPGVASGAGYAELPGSDVRLPIIVGYGERDALGEILLLSCHPGPYAPGSLEPIPELGNSAPAVLLLPASRQRLETLLEILGHPNRGIYLSLPGSRQRMGMTLLEILGYPNGRIYVSSVAGKRLKEMGLWAPVAYVLLCILGTVIVFPATIMWIAGALCFGPFLGTIAVYLGANLGAAAAFLTGRWVARETVEGWIPERLRALSDRLEGGGFRTILLLRLIPVMPYNLLNYLAGLSRMRFRDFMIGGAIGMLPIVVLWVLGVLAAVRVRLDHPITWIPLAILGLLLLVPYFLGKRRLSRVRSS